VNKTQLAKEKAMVLDLESRKKYLTMSELEELLRLKCRTDFLTFAKFVTNGVFKPFDIHRVICEFVQKISEGDPEYRRCVISMPPRSGKSMLISKIFPAWQLGRSPSAQFIMSSYALGLSTENSRAVLETVKTEKFAWVFPECNINKDACNLTAIRTTTQGLIKAASAGGNVTGFGYGVISFEDLPGVGILDDLLADGNSEAVMNSTFEWVQTQFLTRGLPNNAIISMGTRFHKDDVTGRLLTAAPDEWKVLNIPALCVDEETDPLGRHLGESHWKEFFPVSALNLIRKNIGEKDFESLYQGNPTEAAGSIFKHHWIQTYDPSVTKVVYSYVYMTVDTACKDKTKNDYTAMCIWGFNKASQEVHLIDAELERLDFPDLVQKIKTLIALFKVRAVYIEGAASGLPLIQTLRKSIKVSIKELIPSKDKVLRANSVAPIVESGHVIINENLANLEDRISELTSFPYIRTDDFVDAFVYGVMVLRDVIGLHSSREGIKLSSENPYGEQEQIVDHTIRENNTPKILTPRVSRIFSTYNAGNSRSSGVKYR
jgi:predicted phage terminase large subunit-like protein